MPLSAVRAKPAHALGEHTAVDHPRCHSPPGEEEGEDLDISVSFTHRVGVRVGRVAPGFPAPCSYITRLGLHSGRLCAKFGRVFVFARTRARFFSKG